MANNPKILSTAALSPALVERASTAGVVLDVIPFIEVKPIVNDLLKNTVKKIEQQSSTVVFTSAQSINALVSLGLTSTSNWTIYCIGYNTRNTLVEQFGASQQIVTGSDALELSQLIIQNKVKEVVFFCGDIRLNILPDALTKAGIKVNEVTLYETKETPHLVANDYDGILFFSPSAVESYFKMNTPLPGTTFFAIGTTTAAAIKRFTGNPVEISSQPSKETVLSEAITLLTKTTNNKIS